MWIESGVLAWKYFMPGHWFGHLQFLRLTQLHFAKPGMFCLISFDSFGTSHKSLTEAVNSDRFPAELMIRTISRWISPFSRRAMQIENFTTGEIFPTMDNISGQEIPTIEEIASRSFLGVRSNSLFDSLWRLVPASCSVLSHFVDTACEYFFGHSVFCQGGSCEFFGSVEFVGRRTLPHWSSCCHPPVNPTKPKRTLAWPKIGVQPI